MSPEARVRPAPRLLQLRAIKIHNKTLGVLIQHNRKPYYATLGPAKRWMYILQRRAPACYLFGRAGCGVQSNNVTINHLFTRMFEINCYIHPNDRLNLTNAPIGPIWMDNKITKAEIKQMRISFRFFHEKQSNELLLSCHDWVLAGKPIWRKNPRATPFANRGRMGG